jgi:hypothetical protein
MVYLKIIFYGLLAFIERHPIFTLFILLLAIFAPMVLKTIGWIILGVLAVVLILIGLAVFRFHKMRRQMEDQFRSGAGAGFGGAGFSSFGGAQGMTLEELVRQMQEQANARQRAQSGANSQTSTQSQQSQQKRVNDKVGDYVDFEEVE